MDYKSLSHHKAELQTYLNSLNQLPASEFSNFSREEKIALWMNVFNASAIAKVLDFYPVESIQEIPNFWDDPFVWVMGNRYSLRDIRDHMIRQEFHEERAALLLIPGTKSSGPLRNEAYEGNRLAEQLEDQVKQFLMDQRFNSIKAGEKKIKLAPAFQELKEDFLMGYSSKDQDSEYSPQEFAILSFIRIHVDDIKIKEWIEKRKCKIGYASPDLSLNQVS